jgi:hypothetical protein
MTVTAKNPIAQHFHCFARNGRWGTCGFCPKDGHHNVYPEFCEHTDRYDHHLNVDALANQFKVRTSGRTDSAGG